MEIYPKYTCSADEKAKKIQRASKSVKLRDGEDVKIRNRDLYKARKTPESIRAEIVKRDKAVKKAEKEAEKTAKAAAKAAKKAEEEEE